MLTIKINDTSLTIDPKTKLRFDINSPIFETDAIPGSYICPFDLPVAGNDIFENAEFIEVNRIYKKYNCVVYLSDYPLFSGELVLNTSNPKRYRCSVILTGIASDFPDKKLNELEYGNDIVYATINNYAVWKNSVTDGSAICVFPVIHAPNMYGSSDDISVSPANPDYGVDVGKFLNNYIGNMFLYNTIHTPNNLAGEGNRFVMSPQFKLIFIVKKIFENLGYAINGDFFSDAFISKLLFINYFALDQKKKNYSVTADNAVNQYQNISPTDYYTTLKFPHIIEDIDNCWNTSSNDYEIKAAGSYTFRVFFHIKHISHANIYNMDLNMTLNVAPYNLWNKNFSVLVDKDVMLEPPPMWFNDSDIGKKISFKFFSNANTYQFQTRNLTVICTTAQNLNKFADKIHIANHVTGNTVGTVLNALKTNFGLAMWFDSEGKATEVSFLKDVLKTYQSIDITEAVVKDSLEITTEESPGYKLTQKNDGEVKDIQLYTNLGVFIKKSDLPTPDKLNVIAEVLQEGCFYIYKKNDNGWTLSWEKFGTPVAEVRKGKADTDTSMEIGITPNVVMQNRLLPDSQQQGTSEFFDTGINETDMQLLIWHGMQLDLIGHTYPFASALRYALDGSTLSDIELRLDGEFGLFKNYLQSWYDFLDTAEQVCLQMKIGDEKLIELLKLFKPQANKASQQIRKIKYQGSLLLPKTMSFIIPVSGGFIETEITALKEGGIEL